MRIAVSGSHLVGKTTLAEALAGFLPGHPLVPEPYRLLEDEGHTFEEMPSIADFEAQLERSFQCLQDSGPDAVFDRCPLDLVGYLLAHEDAAMFDVEAWIPRLRAHVPTLDLIVFVPIERPDRIAVPSSERRLRAVVDRILRGIVVDDAYGLEVEVIEVAGAREARLHQVVSHAGIRR